MVGTVALQFTVFENVMQFKYILNSVLRIFIQNAYTATIQTVRSKFRTSSVSQKLHTATHRLLICFDTRVKNLNEDFQTGFAF